MVKKFLKFQASAVLVLSLLLSACSNSDSSADKEKAASDAAGNGKTAGIVQLPVFVTPSSMIENLETNSVTTYIEDKFNIKFKFEVAQGSNAGDKKKLLLASGDYPAVFLSGDLTQAEQIEYGKQGVLKPLNDLIEKYGVEIKKAFQQDPELKKSITAPDGNIYALPHINECFHCWYSQKVWINTTWLKKLNLQMPTTTDEYYQVLKAFKTQDPNGNGKQDEIPLSGADKTWHGNPAHFLMNSFIYDNDDNFFFMKDGKVGLSANQPEWRKGLEYMNKLYSEGLIDKEAFTQDNDAMAQVGNRQGDNIVGTAALGHIGMYFSLAKGQDRHKEYVTVAPLKGPQGVAYAGYYKAYGNGQFAITNKATEAQAIAAIKLADYLYSEEHAIMNEYGPEGKYWRKGQPGELDEHGRQAKYFLKPEYFSIGSTQNDTWEQMGITRRTRDIRESWAVPNDPLSDNGYEHRLYLETAKNYEGKQPKETFPLSIFMESADAKEAAQLKTQMNDYIRSNMAQFITGAKKLTDAEWDNYVKGFDGLKLKRYLEIYQKAYDTSFKK